MFSENTSRTHTMSSSIHPSSVLGGVVFSKIRCYLNPEQIGKKLFGKPKVQLVFSYNKKQKFTTKSEIVLNNEKTKKRANWNEQIYFELLSDVLPEFSVSVYNTSISGPDGRLGEATEKFNNVQVFKIEDNRVALPLWKQGEEKIGEVFFHVQLLSRDPPRNMMEIVSDRTNNDPKKKVGLLLINNVKFKNLAGRRGTLEIKLRDESHSTEGYWNTTMKEWRYPIALTIYTNPNLDLIIQCRYTEHERASTRLCLGPNGIHEHIWKSLMNGPFKAGEFSLHDNEYDSARIEFTLSCHRIVTSKTLFYPDEGKQESPFVDTNQITEEIHVPINHHHHINNNINNNINNINNNVTNLARAHTISYTPVNPIGRASIIPEQNEQNVNPEQNFTIAVAQKVHYTPISPRISPQLPPIPTNIADSTNIPQQIHNVATIRQIGKPRPADSSHLRHVINNNMVNSIPVPPKHPRRQITIEEETDLEHIRVNNSPPSSERMIDTQHYENDARDISKPNSNEPNIPPQYKNPPNQEMNPSNKQQFRISPPPPPYPKQSTSVSSPRIICQRFVIVNPLRLGNLRGRREEVSVYPQNKLYKGHHIFTKQDVIIKEFSSQLSYESETAYLKDLSSRYIVKWVDMESDPSTGEFYSITEYYGRALQLEACKFNVGKIKQVFKNICTAVNWIHNKDVVHLDLNPTNIICKEGKDNHKVKICDFETSRQFGDVIQVFPPVPPDDTQSMRSYDHHQQYSTGSSYSHQVYSQFTQFTLGYTCPELLLSYEDDEKHQNNLIEIPAHFNQDIFSIGCILYFLYNNSKPLYSSLEELEESVSLEKGFEYKIRKDIEDDRTADLILKCVGKKPNGRPTIDEVLGDKYFKANVERSHSVNSKNSHDSAKSDSPSRNSRDSAKSESSHGSNGSSSDDDER